MNGKYIYIYNLLSNDSRETVAKIDVMSDNVVIDNDNRFLTVTIRPPNDLPNNTLDGNTNIYVNIDEGAFSSDFGKFTGINSIDINSIDQPEDNNMIITFGTVSANA